MGKKKDKSHKILKPRGPLLPPNKRHKSVKDYDRKRAKMGEMWITKKFKELFEDFINRGITKFGDGLEIGLDWLVNKIEDSK